MNLIFEHALRTAELQILHNSPYGEECYELVSKYREEDWIGCGRNRAVFRRGRVVVKVPINAAGVDDNLYEVSLFERYGQTKGYVPYARCRRAGLLLVMEYVMHVGWHSNQPSWCPSVDCGQLGKNRKGRLVAYDFGYN